MICFVVEYKKEKKKWRKMMRVVVVVVWWPQQVDLLGGIVISYSFFSFFFLCLFPLKQKEMITLSSFKDPHHVQPRKEWQTYQGVFSSSFQIATGLSAVPFEYERRARAAAGES